MTASFTSQGTFTPDSLIAGEDNLQSRQITLLSGQNCVRGAVLGKIATAGASSAAKAGGNTGTGTLVPDVATPVLAGGVAGVYTLRFITATTFSLLDPHGDSIGTFAIGGVNGNAVTVANKIKFALTQAATVFIVGDGFDITVAAGSLKHKLSVLAATDGSEVPSVILAEDTDASAGDKVTVAYHGGVFDENGLTLGAGHTKASIREALRDVGIKLQNSTPR